MDPETVEALLILGELALVIGGGCAAVMGSLWGMSAAAIDYFQRKDHRDELMQLYVEGTVTTKPTILNAYSIPEHKT
ncbi:MAG: hypothetical protein ACYTA3_04005 [Planctomycetota bacterium]|jgi:hypothetical protein